MTPLDLAQAIRALVGHARQHPEDAARALAALGDLAEDDAPAGGPLKRCGCGATYDAAGWAGLPLVGPSDDGTLDLELRNCTAPRAGGGRCMSTIAVVTGLSRTPSTDPEVACARQIDPPGAPSAPAPVCEAGCGRELTAAQLSRGARACSPACRRAAHRAAAKGRRLDALDAAARALAEAREEIARGT